MYVNNTSRLAGSGPAILSNARMSSNSHRFGSTVRFSCIRVQQTLLSLKSGVGELAVVLSTIENWGSMRMTDVTIQRHLHRYRRQYCPHPQLPPLVGPEALQSTPPNCSTPVHVSKRVSAQASAQMVCVLRLCSDKKLRDARRSSIEACLPPSSRWKFWTAPSDVNGIAC